MLLEDISSDGSLSSVDFGKAAQRAGTSPKGIALPPPTEFIKAPLEILDAEEALNDARRERASLIWRVRLQLRRVSEIAKEILLKTWDLVPGHSADHEELPAVEVSDEPDLEEDDQADTGRMPTPVPTAIPEEVRRRNATQWEVRTEVVDMTRRRKPSVRQKLVGDLTLEDTKKKKR